MEIEMADLVKKAREGDKEALITLIMNRKSEYYRLAYVYTDNNEDALDALQDMIVILFDHSCYYSNTHRNCKIKSV